MKVKGLQAATWDDLARVYSERTGGHARTRPMDAVFAWAKTQTDLFVFCDECEGLYHCAAVTAGAR